MNTAAESLGEVASADHGESQKLPSWAFRHNGRGDCSEEARYIAIVITDVEKALGTFNTFVHEDYNNK